MGARISPFLLPFLLEVIVELVIGEVYKIHDLGYGVYIGRYNLNGHLFEWGREVPITIIDIDTYVKEVSSLERELL
jgi:hypothetical protein